MKKYTYQYAREAKQNPYIGFVSFQHFRGDPLYTDSVVDPKRNNCETEDFECYPVPEGIEEKGNAQGFHPDSSVAYIRFLWRDFEPEQGKFDYDFIENILRTAESRGQTVMMRLMPHSTCARDDVPEWLRSIVDCPVRPPLARFKDSPKDPEYIRLFCRAVRALGERFDSDPTLDVMDVSLVGAWGEGHKRDEYPPEMIEYMLDTYVEAFPTTMLLCQMSAPKLLERARKNRPVGTRADAMGQPYHRNEVYPLFLKELPSDLWKTGPISAEAFYWLGEWKRQGWDARDTFDYMLNLHVSTFNAKYLPIPFEWEEEVQRFLDLCGYHFSLESFEVPDALTDRFTAKLTIRNRGNAPIYHAVPLIFRFSSDSGEFTLKSDVDIRTWLPGEHTVVLDLPLPAHSAGNYSVSVALSGDGYPDVYFCTDAARDDKWFSLGTATLA